MKDNFCYRFSCQVYNRNLPNVNLPLNLWGIAIWQRTFFTPAKDRTLWSKKSSRSPEPIKLHLCQNKRKRPLVRIPSIFSNVFVSATMRRGAMERSCHLHSIYSILTAGSFPLQSWRLSKLTIINRKFNFNTCVAQNVPWVSHKLPKPELIFEYCGIKAYFDA